MDKNELLKQLKKGEVVAYSKKVYFTLLQIPLRYLYFATFAVLSFLLLLWWFIFYQPLLEGNNYLIQTIPGLHQQSIILRKTEKQLALVEHSILKSKKEWEIKAQQSFQKKDIHSDSLIDLAQQAFASGLTVRSCKHCAQYTSSAHKPVELAVQGTIEQIINFFETCAKAQIFTCNQCTLTHKNSNIFLMQATFINKRPFN